MRTITRGGILLFSCLLAWAGCSSVPSHPPRGEDRIRSEGYSLLYQLMNDESDVAKVLLFKHVEPATEKIIKEIDSTADEAKKQLEDFHKRDSSLNLEMPNLPDMEKKCRESISHAETKDLLTASGKDFERRLLMTQVQAMNYGGHLAKVLAEQEKDPQRKDMLTKLSERCLKLRSEVIRLL